MKNILVIVFILVANYSAAQTFVQTSTANGVWGNSGNWTNILVIIQAVPGINTAVTVNHNIAVTSNHEAYSVTINPLKSLSIFDGASLEISNDFNINGTFTNNGTLILRGSTNHSTKANLNIGGAVVFNSNFILGSQLASGL